MFGYAHVPQLLPRQRVIGVAALPGVEARFRQAELAHACLIAAGCVAIGLFHGPKPGRDCVSGCHAVCRKSGTLDSSDED